MDARARKSPRVELAPEGKKESEMSAQPSTAQPTTPAISLATLREVLAELKAQEPERGCRWDRAATIVALRTIKPGYADGHWVASECESNRWYWGLRVQSG